jgi:ribonuclease HI
MDTTSVSSNLLTNIYQLNTHKSPLSLNTLIDEKFNSNNNVALLQEPPLSKGHIVGVPPPLTCLTSSSKPRAAIIHNPSLEIWQVPHLSDRDCQTAIWYNDKIKPIMLISAYWDITSPNIPTTLAKAVMEAINKQFQILIGIDSNAHHPAWGSPDTNPRGSLLEAFLTNINLHILNEGDIPTFSRKNCSTHIDITAASTSLLQNIISWAVLEEDMLSDHACLITVINPTIKHVRQFPNLKKTNWSQFKSLLNDNDWSLPQISTATDLDSAANSLTNNITTALNQSTPLVYIKGKAKKLTWWNEDLRNLRRNLRTASKNIDLNNPKKYLEFQQLRTEYQKATRKAKRESWLSFIDSCNTIADTSKLARIITKPKKSPLGLTLTPEGTPTWSSLESVQNIMHSLFPGSTTTKPSNSQPNPSQNSQQPNLETNSWINQESVQFHINQLPPRKAPGPDQITNTTLKNLPKQVIAYLTHIYQHCILLSYVPINWCCSKAIFIPKPNKPNKEDPKSYRPICLSNTLFKILEKLIQTYLERSKIYPSKLSARQHGFRSNRSTLTALSTLLNYIESNLHQNQQTLAIFLDIQGAFDNISPTRAIKILEAWGTPVQITNTLLSYYNNREISTTINPSNKTLTIYPTKGTAQGNVLSPMLWNCVINQVGSIMDKYNLGGCLFADDVVIAASNPSTQTATNKLQQALNEIVTWADEEGLSFNVSKSHAVLFYGQKQHDPPIYHPIYLKNQDIAYKNETMYLGVLITDQLSWSNHFNMVFNRAKKDMVMISKSLHKKYGPSPKLTHWIYTGIIRPKITYAAHLWCGNISNYTLDKKSRQIQRWALTKMGPIREHTPTAGLEIITKTIPLHIHLQEVSLKTAHNFLTINFTLTPPPKGHMARWFQMLKQYIPLAFKPSDKGLKTLAPHFQNRLDTPSKEEGIKAFTDGSKLGPDCGSGFILQWGDKTRLGMSYNGKNFTVFLSEVRAIALAAEKILAEKITTPTVNIYSDCSSAIAAILGTRSTSKTVQHCWSILKQLDDSHKWSLSWVKAHVGISGNETADLLAKRATQMNTLDPQLPTAPIHIYNSITKFSMANWNTYWNGRSDCRQTKLWFPSPNPKESKNINRLSRQDFGLMVRWLTGHCFLARHESIIHNEEPICNRCFLDDQTPWHLLQECPATRTIRSNIPPNGWQTGIILKAIKNMDYLEILPEVPTQRPSLNLNH